jgi:signal transduction histidine kinase
MDVNSKNTVLYVDDEENNLVPFKAYFRKKYEVHTATNAADAFAILASHNIHIIITDQRMPVMNGIEFLEKTIAPYPDALRLLITAYSELDVVIEAINRGQISKFLQKPWDWEKLSLAIENCALTYNAKRDLKLKNRELQKTNDELNKFIYSISHDLREPLTTMLGLIQLSKKEPLKAKDYENYFEMIKTCVLKQDALTRNMIDYYRNTHAEEIKEAVDFKTLVAGAYKYVRDHDKQIHFESDVEQTATFSADLFRLEMILKNLLSNAVKYQNPANQTPQVKVKITTNEKEASIIVSDNGMGIKSEYTPHIFNLFYRAGVPGNKEGSGIGLYIVKEAVERMKGAIVVESAPLVGTTFKITIPN